MAANGSSSSRDGGPVFRATSAGRSLPADPSSVKKNRPKATRLRQQQLPAWQPILTATTVIPTIFLIGIVFIPIGIFLLIESNKVQEWSTYYENCTSQVCRINFDITEPFLGNVFFYYGLENYFQNHRRYMKSRNDVQLLGMDLTSVAECEPFATNNLTNRPYAPCGAIANSMFSDLFYLRRLSAGGFEEIVPWSTDGLVWETDKQVKFQNPKGIDLCASFDLLTDKPPLWKKRPCELDPSNSANNGFQNADFIIWMRTAALPDFRKPYRVLDRSKSGYENGLPVGSYSLTIDNNYDVKDFQGKKSFIISTTTMTGGRNSFLGFAYIAVGSICIALAIAFLLVHIKFGHHLSELAIVN